MTYKPNYDRTNWRREETRELIEAARDSGHELAIALGERLDKVARQRDYEIEDWVD
jgi:hydroxymethylpyrimidine pyrophosphatase-like HAD family hydrolase